MPCCLCPAQPEASVIAAKFELYLFIFRGGRWPPWVTYWTDNMANIKNCQHTSVLFVPPKELRSFFQTYFHWRAFPGLVWVLILLLVLVLYVDLFQNILTLLIYSLCERTVFLKGALKDKDYNYFYCDKKSFETSKVWFYYTTGFTAVF